MLHALKKVHKKCKRQSIKNLNNYNQLLDNDFYKALSLKP